MDTIIIDRAALVNILKPSSAAKTFSDYASGTFVPDITAELRHVKRIDLVWDEYVENSLKATTRRKRRSGVRQRVAPDNKLPRFWKDFLREEKNEQELFGFLAQSVTSVNIGEK